MSITPNGMSGFPPTTSNGNLLAGVSYNNSVAHSLGIRGQVEDRSTLNRFNTSSNFNSNTNGITNTYSNNNDQKARTLESYAIEAISNKATPETKFHAIRHLKLSVQDDVKLAMSRKSLKNISSIDFPHETAAGFTPLPGQKLQRWQSLAI
jgi:hypothetical protein